MEDFLWRTFYGGLHVKSEANDGVAITTRSEDKEESEKNQ